MHLKKSANDYLNRHGAPSIYQPLSLTRVFLHPPSGHEFKVRLSPRESYIILHTLVSYHLRRANFGRNRGEKTEGENPIWDSIEMGLLQGLVLQAVGLAIGIVLSLIVLPFDILREGLRKVVENLGTSTSHFTPI